MTNWMEKQETEQTSTFNLANEGVGQHGDSESNQVEKVASETSNLRYYGSDFAPYLKFDIQSSGRYIYDVVDSVQAYNLLHGKITDKKLAKSIRLHSQQETQDKFIVNEKLDDKSKTQEAKSDEDDVLVIKLDIALDVPNLDGGTTVAKVDAGEVIDVDTVAVAGTVDAFLLLIQ